MVELVRTGRSPEELSREFEPSAQAIRNWVVQAERDEGRRGDGPSTAEREELRRLRRENRRLREERDILAKATAWVLVAVLTGILTDYAAFRPIREKSVTAVLITSFAFSTLLQNAALLFISPRPRNVPVPDLFSETVQFAGVIVPVRNILTIVLALGMLAVFALVMRRSVLGIAMRAAVTHFTMARMLGVPANLIISAAFATSGLLAGVVALVWFGRIGTVVPGIGLEPLLIAFIATVIGGMRSLQGAVLGGYILALIDMGLNFTLPQDLLKFRDAFTFSAVILILLWRPDGLIKGPASGRRI